MNQINKKIKKKPQSPDWNCVFHKSLFRKWNDRCSCFSALVTQKLEVDEEKKKSLLPKSEKIKKKSVGNWKMKKTRKRVSSSWWQTLSLTLWPQPEESRGSKKRIESYKGGIPATHIHVDWPFATTCNQKRRKKVPPASSSVISCLPKMSRRQTRTQLGEPLSFPLLVFRSARLFAIAFIYICYISSEEEEQEQDLFFVLFANCCQLWFIGLKTFSLYFLGGQIWGLLPEKFDLDRDFSREKQPGSLL
jgi:hypothetical protein